MRSVTTFALLGDARDSPDSWHWCRVLEFHGGAPHRCEWTYETGAKGETLVSGPDPIWDVLDTLPIGD